MFKHRLMLSVAATALFAGPVFADTTLTTVQTKEVETSTVNGGKPDNVIFTGGGVTINAAGPAVLINTANTVTATTNAVFSNNNTTNAEGIVIDASGGPYTVSGNILDLEQATVNVTGTGTGKTGVILQGGQFTGDIDLSANSAINVHGDGSIGVAVASTSTLIGDLDANGAITVSQSNASSVTASNIIGLNMTGTINGNLNVGGPITVEGAGAEGVVVNSAAATAITGTLKLSSTITSTGIATVVAKKINPEASSAVIVSSSIGGGIFNSGPLTIGDTTTAAGNITMNGSGVAFQIEPGASATSDITIGSVPTTVDGSNLAGYGFTNHGTITADSLDANPTALVGVEIGGSSTFKAIVANGFLNTGTVQAVAVTSNTSATKLDSPSATAFEVGNNGVVPTIVNSDLTGSKTTTMQSSVSGPGGGTAIGILIADTGQTNEIDNLLGATISASATTTDTTIASLTAVAITDQSGTLTKIVNTGTITATATTLDNGLQSAVAIDAPVGSNGVTILNGDTANGPGVIIGDIKLGSGSDTITLVGTSAATKSTITGNIDFGTSSTAPGAPVDVLNVGNFSTVSGGLVSDDGTLAVNVTGTGELDIDNTKLLLATGATTLQATKLSSLTVSNTGILGLTVSANLSGPVVSSSGPITLAHGTTLNTTYGSFLPTGNYVLLDAPAGQLTIPDAASYVGNFSSSFLFTSNLCLQNVDAAHGGSASLACGPDITSADSQLVLQLTAKTADQIGLTGFAKQMYPIVNQVLPLDNTLGAAVIAGATDQASAQKIYDAFAPTVNGGTRALAIALTDQATGPVGARQRVLRTYGKQDGDSTLWGVEYAQFLKDPGQTIAATSSAPAGLLSGYKDHGFGFSLGADGGSARDGWYGGALSFYTGDIGEIGDRSGQDQTEWYMLTAYSDWRGTGLFLDSDINAGVTQFKNKRNIDIVTDVTTDTTFDRTAQSKHIGTFLSGGISTGGILKYSGTTLTPQISLDGLIMRENGYHEGGAQGATGDAFDLTVSPAYSESLRSFVGIDLRQDINVGDFFLQPQGRIGYRYDFLDNAPKVNAFFTSTPGTPFSITGPDPAQGNVVAGATLAASTETWSIGVSFDWVRGTNGVMQQSGEFTLVGRI